MAAENEPKKKFFVRIQKEVPRWRILLAWPFMKIGIGILGGQNITLEEAPPAPEPP